MNSTSKYLLTISEYAKFERISQITVRRMIKSRQIPSVKIMAQKGYRRNHEEFRIHYSDLSQKAKERFDADRGLNPENRNEPDIEDREYLGLTQKMRERLDTHSFIAKCYIEAVEGLPWGRKGAFEQQFAKARQYFLSFA